MMRSVTELHVLRVFCAEDESAGNLLGVFPNGTDIAGPLRQGIANELGFSETVFIDENQTARIFTPTRELAFAGHPLVGAAWLLSQLEATRQSIHTSAGEIPFSQSDGLTWIKARAEFSPDWNHLELPSVDEVLNLDSAPDGLGHVQAWAWENESQGIIRARVFASDYGIDEDPATGSAAVCLCARLGQDVKIFQGPRDGESEIHARLDADGWVSLGGRVRSGRAPTLFSYR